MGHHKLFYHNAKSIRDQLNETVTLAAEILQNEQTLILKLLPIDQQRFYVRYGYKSLSGFCNLGLKFSKTQTQRIVTQVRRYEPTGNIVVKARTTTKTTAT
ncbi:MAG: hypothetical protein WA160_10120 [Pseudobdellovibrio sp.]